jgi:L-lactate dehydrogenase complex protein LldG
LDASREEAAIAELGVTGVDYAIADLGSCVIQPREGISRTTSLLPPLHVAIVEPAQIVGDLSDFMALWAADAQRDGDPGSYMNIITGPSRTADIEQILVVGVHGPKEVHMVVLDS